MDEIRINITANILQALKVFKETEAYMKNLYKKIGDITPVSNAFKKMQDEMKMIKTLSGQVNGFWDWKEMGIKNITPVTKNVIDVTSKLKEMRGALMGVGFGFLFMGMQMNRAIVGFLNQAAAAYKLVGTENTIFIQKTNELGAAWAFFKFSLIDALSQSPLFIMIIDWLINIINWLGRLKPGTLAIIAIGLAAAGALSWLAMMAGQIGLLVMSLASLPSGAFAVLATGIWQAVTAFGAFIALGIKAIFVSIAVAVELVVSAVNALTASMLANPITWIIGLFTALIYLLLVAKFRFGDLGTTFANVGANILQVLNGIGTGILEFMLLPIRAVIGALNLLIIGYNKVAETKLGKAKGMTPLDLIPQPDIGYGVLGYNMQERIDRMIPYKESMSSSESFAAANQAIVSGIRDIFNSSEFTNAIATGTEKGVTNSTSSRGMSYNTTISPIN